MADFEDITGWREELEAFERTEEGEAFFAGNERYRKVKLPIGDLVQAVELVLADPELHDALRKKMWFTAYVEENDLDTHNDVFWESHPSEAIDTFIAFRRWYLMKSNVRFDSGKSIVVDWLATDLEDGKLSSLRTAEAESYIKERYWLYVSFPGEEA